MSLAELQAEINKEFNTDMHLIQLFENSTLGAMARQIDPATGSLPASKGLSFTIPAPSNKDDLYDIDMNPQPKDQGLPYKTVVVMGATGFLGKADAQNAERQKYRQDSCNRSPTTSIQLAGNFLRPESTTAYGRPQRTATQPVQTSGPGDSQAVSSPTNPDALLRGKVDMVI